jgi:Fur family ferric uptake transcriptional regulator
MHYHYRDMLKSPWSKQRVYDIPGCPGNLRGLAPRGFTVDHHEVTLYGRCSDCGKRRAAAAP